MRPASYASVTCPAHRLQTSSRCLPPDAPAIAPTPNLRPGLAALRSRRLDNDLITAWGLKWFQTVSLATFSHMARIADAPDLLKPIEVGARLKLSRASVYRLIGAGELATVHVGKSRSTRIEESELRAYIERNRAERKAAS